jgi:homoserine O-acetyltransferase/O-succinyltransferase
MPILKSALAVLLTFVAFYTASAQQAQVALPIQQGDYIAHDFKFGTGETLHELRLHYRTLGQPKRDASGHVSNAVLILHGTGGTGAQFLGSQFAGVLFEPGQLLDAAKYYIILPDGIGHGGSSKPSDGKHAHFPSYDYDDMVAAQHLLLTEGLHVDHLRLIMGTSMGCMHSWVWGETYPGFSDAFMPLACLPVQIAGRNRIMRKMAMDAIRNDPAWNNGEYTAQPPGLKTSLDMLLIMGSSPLQMQEHFPTRDQADAYLEKFISTRFADTDANDFLSQFNSSRNYDPSAKLATISVPVMAINSADDFVNPPELNIMPEAIKKVPRGKFILLPITEQTHGHGTHTLPAIWQGYLAEILKETEPTAH